MNYLWCKHAFGFYLSVPQAFLTDPKYAEEEDLAAKLEMFKSQHSAFTTMLIIYQMQKLQFLI